MRILAFIPARGGSKGIPRKNLVSIAGKPLLQYAIEAAAGCGANARIFLSSDDPEIVSVGRQLGVDSSGYLRPSYIAGDSASIVDAVMHALDWLQERGERFDVVVLLQPTSPLRTVEDVEAALDLFRMSQRASTLVSVHRVSEHPFECLKVSEQGWNWMLRPDRSFAGRQEYQGSYYFVNGAIYIATVEHLRTRRTFVEEANSILYVMPPERGIDIDEPAQVRLAEWVLAESKSSMRLKQ